MNVGIIKVNPQFRSILIPDWPEKMSFRPIHNSGKSGSYGLKEESSQDLAKMKFNFVVTGIGWACMRKSEKKKNGPPRLLISTRWQCIKGQQC